MLSTKTVSPLVYAFYISVLSLFSIVIFIFGLMLPEVANTIIPSLKDVTLIPSFAMFLSIINGISFFFSIYFLFKSLIKNNASDVFPVVGAVSAIGTFVLSFVFFNEVISPNFLISFFLLIVGTILVSHLRFNRTGLIFSILSGLVFSVYFITGKEITNEIGFTNGFFWTRVTAGLLPLTLLFIPRFNKVFLKTNKKVPTTKVSLWMVSIKSLGGLSALFLFKASELGSVSLVQALGGLQFVFLFIFSLLFGHKVHEALEEGHSPREFIYKAVAVGIISLGLFILFI
ncbi:MAG: hypothetical protein WCW87_02075 [Candidatus Paceibacterota bacterium]